MVVLRFLRIVEEGFGPSMEKGGCYIGGQFFGLPY